MDVESVGVNEGITDLIAQETTKDSVFRLIFEMLSGSNMYDSLDTETPCMVRDVPEAFEFFKVYGPLRVAFRNGESQLWRTSEVYC